MRGYRRDAPRSQGSSAGVRAVSDARTDVRSGGVGPGGRVHGRLAIGRPGVPERYGTAMGTAVALKQRNTHLGFFPEEEVEEVKKKKMLKKKH